MPVVERTKQEILDEAFEAEEQYREAIRRGDKEAAHRALRLIDELRAQFQHGNA